LKDYLRRMMAAFHNEPFYERSSIQMQEAARIFLVAIEAPKPLPVLALQLLEKENRNSNYALDVNVQPMTEAETVRLHRLWRNKLDNRCKDLLRIVEREHDYRGKTEYRVEFLHASVRQFLQDNYRTQLQAQAGDGFDPTLAACKLMLALTKVSISYPRFSDVECSNIIDEFLRVARVLDLRNASTHGLVAELDRMMSEENRVPGKLDEVMKYQMFGKYIWFDRYSLIFLRIATAYGLRNYVISRIDADPTFTKVNATLLLCYALLDYVKGFSYPSVDVHILKALLRRGANLKQRQEPKVPTHKGGSVPSGPRTVWQIFPRECLGSTPRWHGSERRFMLTKILLESNADPNATISLADPDCHGQSYKGREDNARSWSVLDVFKRCFTNDEVARLEEIMKYMRERRAAELQSLSLLDQIRSWTRIFTLLISAFLVVPLQAFRQEAVLTDQRVTERSDDWYQKEGETVVD